VKLINTDGMAFIGPGSEWFWTALSGIVLAVTFLAIYRQLRLQRSLAAIEQIDAVMRDFFSERMLRHQLDVLLAQRAGVDPTELPAGAAAAIVNYFEKLGMLARKGHIDRRLLEPMGPICQTWWATLAPLIRRTHVEMGVSTTSDGFGWLAGQLAGMHRRAGVTVTFDDAYVRGSLDRRLGYVQGMLRVEQSLRTVIIASPETAPPAPPATPAAAEG
jgi:hypothetical protein